MDPQSFSSTARGSVRRDPSGFWAFHPSPLPRQIELTQELSVLLDQATGAVHRLGGVGRLLPNAHLLIGPHLRLEAVQSSKIEGTRTDVGQLLLFEAGRAPDEEARADAEEVRNYVDAMEHGRRRLGEDFPLSMRLFREMHKVLLRGVRGRYRRPGELRTSSVWIGGSSLNNAVFVPPPPERAMEALDDLELFLHDDSLPLLIQLGLAHYQFEAIHPFLDGNGRIGRLMIPLMLEYREVLPQPLLYLSAYFERNRIGYYDLLLRTSQKGDVVPWLTFFLRGVLTQAQDAEERTVRRVELQAGLRSALLDERQPRSVVRLGDLLFTSPILNSSVVAQRLDVAAPTAHRAIATLVERGDLVEITGGRRHRVYRAGKIFDAVYGKISPPGDGTDA